MEKIMDGMLYTFGSSIIIVPIFYFSSLQLMKFKKKIVSTSVDQFTNNLFGSMFRQPPTNVLQHHHPLNDDANKKEDPSEITSFFLKKRGIN
jgi:hypothetical protein